ncbi:ribosome biogenesis protein ytm1 [Microsporum audouinii]
MPGTVSADKVHRELLKFITDGSFPESESITEAEYPVPALPVGLEQISEARQKVEKEICALSQDKASEVDEWILQAKQLHEDIERSKLTAREIVKNYEKSQALRSQVDDTAAKVGLLRRESAFTQSLRETLEKARVIDQNIDAARAAGHEHDLETAIQKVEDICRDLEQLALPRDSSIITILTDKASSARRSICATLQNTWNDLVCIEKPGTLTVKPDGISVLDLHLKWLSELGVLETTLASFRNELLNHILQPILSPPSAGPYNQLFYDKNYIGLKSQDAKPTIPDVLNSVLSLFTFVKNHLPTKVLEQISTALTISACQLLISEWLSPAIPVAVEDMNTFERVSEEVLRFSKTLAELGWNEPSELGSWINQIPRLWLSRRRAHALDRARWIVYHNCGEYEKAERIEKQQVSQSDGIFQGNHADADVEDGWNANWEDDNDEADKSASKAGAAYYEDEDVSAWGLDDEEDNAEPEEEAGKGNEEDDDVDDAWGWGADESNDNPPEEKSQSIQKTSKSEEDNLLRSAPKELILREFYTVTRVPDAIVEIIRDQMSDSERLKRPEYSSCQISTSAAALLGIPTLVVAMFKAMAPVFYAQKSASSHMYLYNDSIYLAERLRAFSEEHEFSRLGTDIRSIERFGRLSYGREMHSQRTILTDLLDGCQGFSSCNTQPYLGECERAIKATADRVRNLHSEWKLILSPSVLLQSIGSLLATGINKIILDIEDLGDISDPESQRLAGFCSVISKLEELFLPDTEEGNRETEDRPIAMAAIYVPNWLKFQYLMNILESSLADIKFLWTEGELKLEFSPDELIDLIKALFADSEHRRKAIIEIRNSA